MAVRVIVAGAIAQHPIGGGGNTWAFLQYVLGLRRLGCEVLYVEHVDRGRCWNEAWERVPFEESANVRCLRGVAATFGLEGQVALLERDGGYFGLSAADVEAWASAADLFINLSGRFHLQPILRAARRRLYVDLDPGFTQVWQAQYGVEMNLAGHDAYATVGLNIGRANCPFPTLGLTWHPTLPPVVMAEWRTTLPPGAAYTTVGDWRGYSPVEWQGVWYGQKAEEFRSVLPLPVRVAVPLEPCLAIHPDEPDKADLMAHGWRLTDPRQCAADAATYRDFIFHSRGEFSVAKQGYVRGRTGWVSDRTACYLAAGRPAVVQNTELGAHLALGNGLVTFDDLDGAVAAMRNVEREYAAHAVAARELAASTFDADRVLARLLDVAGA